MSKMVTSSTQTESPESNKKKEPSKVKLSDEDTIKNLLDGCWDVINMDRVYSVALQSLNSEKMVRLLAESLHQRWLSDSGFAPVAARLAYKLCDVQSKDGDFKFGSVVFAMLMNDYRDRVKLRTANPVILCNSTQFAFEFYNHFRHQGAFYEALIDPLLDMLDLMMSECCTEYEIECASHLLQIYGAHLQTKRYKRMQHMCVKVRRILITADGLSSKIRFRLLEITELSLNRWNCDNLQGDVSKLYDQMRDKFGDHYLSIMPACAAGVTSPTDPYLGSTNSGAGFSQNWFGQSAAGSSASSGSRKNSLL